MDGHPDPGSDPYELAADLRSVVTPLGRLLRRQTGGQLTATQSSVLGAISRLGPISLSDLAAHERLSLPMVSKVIDALHTHGFASRIDDPDDGRVVLVELSQGGRDWLEESRELRDRWLTERLGGLDDDELATIAAAIPCLVKLVRDRP